jgi:hypothetical protein
MSNERMGTEYLRAYAVRRLQKSYAAMECHTVPIISSVASPFRSWVHPTLDSWGLFQPGIMADRSTWQIGPVDHLSSDSVLLEREGALASLAEVGVSDAPEHVSSWIDDSPSQRSVGRWRTSFKPIVRESRRSTRVRLKVVIEARSITEPLACEGETFVVNLHGALISTAVPLRVGMRIEIHVLLTDKRAAAKVVYVDPDQPRHCGIGLEEPQNIWGVGLPPDDWHEGDSG